MIKIDADEAKRISDKLQIPPRPDLLAALQAEEKKAEPDIDNIAEIISQDLSLAAAILKAVNSPAYGLNRTFTDIKQSVMMLGYEAVFMLATFFELKRALSGPAGIDIQEFWDDSLRIAEMAVICFKQLNIDSDCSKDMVYSAGLFHECGLALMAMRFDNYAEHLPECRNSLSKSFTEVEREYFNTDHATVGYFITNGWHLPKFLCEVILLHHDVSILDDNNYSELQKDLYAVLKLSCNIHFFYKKERHLNEWKHVKDEVLGHLQLSDFDYGDLQLNVIDSWQEGA